MAAPIANGTIPIMAGGVAQPVIYQQPQQQPAVVLGVNSQLQTTTIPQNTFLPGKRSYPRNPHDEQW